MVQLMHSKQPYLGIILMLWQEKNKHLLKFVKQVFIKCLCDPGGTRTHNLQNRNLIFYPLNYGAICVGKSIKL